MAKTVKDYMNDPEIIDEPMALREIHAIRLKIQDETENMTADQRREYSRKKVDSFFDGATPKFVNFSGRGRLVSAKK
jgi:predicted DNA-binding protein (UPF0251 family)